MVEHRLAKARVASSNLVFRSNVSRAQGAAFYEKGFALSAATVKHLDPTQVELEIALSEQELAVARERAFRELAKNVKIPGFRPGKVPRRIFEAQYGTQSIEERAMDAVVPGAYSKALEENDLSPVDHPQMELLPVEEGQPTRVRATVAVQPKIELHDYKGFALVSGSTAITDENVDDALHGLRKEAAIVVPVDRPVELGDVPTIDFAGKIDGVPFDGGTAEQQPTELIADNFIPGFALGIVGMTAGETKDIDAQFPAEYANAELAGKTAVFTITVHENKVHELAELDDEFAKRFGGDSATVAGLRDELRNRLEANTRLAQRRDLTGQVLEKLIAAYDFPLPSVMVEREIDGLVGEAKSYVERNGLVFDDWLTQQEKTPESLRDEYRVEAEKRVRSSLLIEAIAKAENITATNADIEAEIAQMSAQYNQPREAILKMLQSNFNALIDGIVRTKTLDLLIDSANVTERAPETDPPEAASTEVVENA